MAMPIYGRFPGNKHQDKLKVMKRHVENTWQYFEDNYRRYQNYTRLVFDTGLTPDDIAKLMITKRPNIEFNILEAYISRLIGEFIENEPMLLIRAADSVRQDTITPEFLKMIQVLEDHVRDIFFNGTNDGLRAKL